MNQLFHTILTNLLSIHVVQLDEKRKQLESFEQKYCFHEMLQPMFTANTLSFLVDSMQEYTIYEIADHLGIHLLFFQFEKEILFLGPYVKTPYDEMMMQSFLVSNKIPISFSMSLKLYYTSLPMLSTHHILKTLEALMISFVPTIPQFSYRKLYGLSESSEQKKYTKSNADDSLLIHKRYDFENHFLNMITTGNIAGTKDALYQMQSSSNSVDITTLYSGNVQASMSILRTLARKAAERSGLSVMTIHEITQRSAQLTANGQTTPELLRNTTDMIIELTTAVHNHLTHGQNYSKTVTSILEFVKQNLEKDISLKEVAKNYGMSPSTLSKLFKKEVGITLSQYIAKKRCEQAATLLKETDAQIQDIAYYVGYTDNNYFVKVFKQIYGVTPSAYRQ